MMKMKKAVNIKNGNVNMNCNYCGGCGYHKMSCPTQNATVFIPTLEGDEAEEFIRKAESAERATVDWSKQMKQMELTLNKSRIRMKETELRIGNWVKLKDQEVNTHAQVEGLGNLQHVAGQLWSIEELEPIPLTYEWINSVKGDGSFRLKFVKSIAAFEIQRKYTSLDSEEWIFISNCRYRHEWQNLYFALTGEELTN